MNARRARPPDLGTGSRQSHDRQARRRRHCRRRSDGSRDSGTSLSIHWHRLWRRIVDRRPGEPQVMTEPHASPGGLLTSVRRFADSSLGAVQNRLELFVTELHEEKCRVIEILILASAAIFLGMMAMTFVTLTIVVYFFRENAFLPALVGVSLVYLGTCVFAALRLRSRLTK